MSNFQYNPSSKLKDSANQMDYLSEGIVHKIPCTTKFTENSFQWRLPESFLMGKNDLLEKNTQSGFDSDDNDSQLSFEDRLDLNHQKMMNLTLYKYFSQNFFFNQNILIEERISLKSWEIMREIEEKTMEQIKRKYGTEEAQKIKLVMNFLKKNQETSKIYYEVIKRFSPSYRVSCYFLLKETVKAYLNARQELKKQWRNFTQNEINSYFSQNLTKICKTFKQDQKLAIFKFNTNDPSINKKFQEFILTWMTTFYLSKQGLPSNQIGKDLYGRQWPFQTCQQSDRRKKIKK